MSTNKCRLDVFWRVGGSKPVSLPFWLKLALDFKARMSRTNREV